MRPNMDAEIAVLQSVLANAKDEHQLKAGLAHAIELLEENVPYAAELADVLRAMVGEQCDYMIRNKLGDPEGEHNIKWARAVLAKNPNPSGQLWIEASSSAEASGPVGLGPHQEALTEELAKALRDIVVEAHGPGRPYSQDSFLPPHFIEAALAVLAKYEGALFAGEDDPATRCRKALTAERDALAATLRRMLMMCENANKGAWDNGVTHDDIAEGDYLADTLMAEARTLLAQGSCEEKTDPTRRQLNEAVFFLGLEDSIQIVTPYSTAGELIQHVISKARECK